MTQSSEVDTELQAIRSLVKGSQPAVAAQAGGQAAAPTRPTMSRRHAALDAPDTAAPRALPSSTHSVAPSSPQKSGRVAGVLRHAMAWAVCQIKSYRPVRKNILWTSAVLLLLLKPFMVIGWSIVLVLVVWAAFLALGADAFWRKVISMFQTYKYRRPDSARVLKLRAYALAKKWDRFLNWLPDRMADSLRVPDLRELVKADVRHDAALSDRLTRLRDDPLADF